MRLFYSMSDISSEARTTANVFIFAYDSDDRALEIARKLKESSGIIETIIIIQYNEIDSDCIKDLFPTAKVHFIRAENSQIGFLRQLNQFQTVLSCGERVLIDISCIHIPEMFILLKYLCASCKQENLQVAYSVPFDYEFSEEPFTSYCSYYGDLLTQDLTGFGGISTGEAHSKMIVFLGFEGILSSKVIEDIRYDNLLLVNNLPSFFPKYKDISMINNCELLTSHHSKLKYVPANNPFEAYNFLDAVIDETEQVCTAPLSTKPVALGVCLYALNHPNLRVVYPVSEQYRHHNTNRVHKSYLYEIPLKCP